jgi:hypothetical protein
MSKIALHPNLSRYLRYYPSIYTIRRPPTGITLWPHLGQEKREKILGAASHDGS